MIHSRITEGIRASPESTCEQAEISHPQPMWADSWGPCYYTTHTQLGLSVISLINLKLILSFILFKKK